MKNLFFKIKDYFEINKKLGKIKLSYKFIDYEKNKKKVNINKKIDLNFFTQDLIDLVIAFLEKCNISIHELQNHIDKNYDKAYNFNELNLRVKPLDKGIKSLINDEDFINNIKIFINNNDFLMKEMIIAYLNYFSVNL